MFFGLFGKEEPKATLFVEPRSREAQTFARFLLRENKPLRKAFEQAFGAKTKLNDDASKLEITSAPGRLEQIQVGYKHLRDIFEQGAEKLTDLEIRWTARLLKYAAIDVVYADGPTEKRSLEEKFADALRFDAQATEKLRDALIADLKTKIPGPETP